MVLVIPTPLTEGETYAPKTPQAEMGAVQYHAIVLHSHTLPSIGVCGDLLTRHRRLVSIMVGFYENFHILWYKILCQDMGCSTQTNLIGLPGNSLQ
jgi:hypothetical protein